MKRILALIVAIALLLPLFPVSVEAEDTNSKILRFDLGAAGVEEGYIGVSANDAYSKEVGYGFANTEAVEDVSASGQGALADAVRFISNVPNHIFKVDLPSGVYKITVTTGDVESTTITAEGVAQLLFLTGSNAVDSFTIPVTDGQLNIHAGSGVGTAFSISALEIERTSTGTTTKPTIWACGDSTVASYYNVPSDAKRGWGQYLCNYVDTDVYDIRNISVSGIRSDKMLSSYFSTAERYGKSGDILLLSVGINDYIDEYKLHPDAMDATGYIANMTEMVRRAKAKGMTVYLVKQQGELADCKAYPLIEKKWFSDEIDEIAAAEKVGVIDMFHPWLEFCLEKTSIEARNYYAPGENLHPNALGADKLAQIVSEQLFPSKEPGDGTDEDPYKDLDMSKAVYYETQVSGGPVANPHKGYVMTVYNPDMLYKTKHPYGIEGSMDNRAWDVVTICSGVLFWEDVNPAEGVYNWEEIDTMLEACEQAGMTYGIRIIPYTTSKGSDDNYGIEHDFVPQWVYEKGAKQNIATYKYGDPSVELKVPDWSDPVYIQAYKDFTKALADKYDGDPRVEYVEIRAFGNMGEWHTSEFVGNEMPSVEIQKDMLDYFASVFKKTMCCVLSDARGEVYDYALSRGITKRNNGLILSPNAEWDLRPAYKANLPTMADNHSTYEIMLDEEGKLSGEYLKWTPEHYRECIEIAHLSIYALDQEGSGSYKFYSRQKELIDEMANRLGYNFTVTSAKRSGNRLLVTIKNTGLAPAFFNIELAAELTDENGNKLGTFGEPVKIEKGTFADETEQTFLFTYDGQIAPDAKLCLAMYDSDNYLVAGKDPTVKFDNKNTLPNNRLLLVEKENTTGSDDGDESANESGGGADNGAGGVCTDGKAHTLKTTTTKATLTTDGKKETKCSVCNKVIESKVIPAPATVKLSATSYTYNKKAKKPSVIVKDSRGNVIASANYDVTYAKGRKKVGKYKVKVTFKGDYSGTKNLTFKILPPKTGVKSVKAGNKSLVVKWKKKTKEVTGYEIQYSTSKNFKKGTKKVKVKSAKKTSATISKLKAGKKYYVRIRTYKKVGKKYYYSKWSARKTMKTKKSLRCFVGEWKRLASLPRVRLCR